MNTNDDYKTVHSNISSIRKFLNPQFRAPTGSDSDTWGPELRIEKLTYTTNIVEFQTTNLKAILA